MPLTQNNFFFNICFCNLHHRYSFCHFVNWFLSVASTIFLACSFLRRPSTHTCIHDQPPPDGGCLLRTTNTQAKPQNRSNAKFPLLSLRSIFTVQQYKRAELLIMVGAAMLLVIQVRPWLCPSISSRTCG